MSPARPRRAAAQKANTAITDLADSDTNSNSNSTSYSTIISRPTRAAMSSRTSSARRPDGKTAAATYSRNPPSSPSDSDQHIHVTVKLPASKLRQATSSRHAPSIASKEGLVGGEILQGKRNRQQKKSYVLDSSDEDDDDAEGEDDEDAEGEDDDVDMGDDDDAEREIVVTDRMDLDAEGDDDDDLGDEDADGEDDDMDITPSNPSIKVSGPSQSTAASKTKTTPLKSAMKPTIQARDSDDDELSELESEEDDDIQDTVVIGGGRDLADEDAEGEEDDEIEAAAEPADGDDDELGSDDSQGATPDMSKMTKRQRARFEDGDGEVQAKKVFTAEELSMRRAEMARRRRNLSEKRNEEVKMETINKLLKKQAPKTKGKGQGAGDDSPGGGLKPNPVFVRWISTKEGCRVAVPDEMLAGPVGKVFVPGGLKGGRMVEEVL